MGVDYDTYLGLGRQMRINYQSFPYDRYYEFKDEFEKKYPKLKLILTSQEYKGTICATTMFVGQILFETDPRNHEVMESQRLISLIEETKELSELDEACAELQDKLGLEDQFGKYGINVLVRCF